LIDDVEDEVDLPPEVPDDVDEVDEVPVVKSAPAVKKGRGRPKGKPNRSSQIMEPIDDAEPSTVEEPIEEVQQQQQQPEEVDEAEEEEEPVKRRPGRPSRKDRSQPEPKPAQPTSRKRRSFRDSTGEEESDEQVEPQDEPPEEPARPPKKQRTQASANSKAPVPKATKPAKPTPPAAKAEAPAKSRGRPKKAAKEVETGEPEAGEASFMALQRGPPMPKARGLVSVRRDADSVTQTRSGRHSYRPLHWWRGDEVVRNEEEQGDLFYHDEFVVSSVKEVVRVPEEEAPSKRSSRGRPRSASAKPKTRSKQRRALLQDNEEPEEWELNEGNVMGEVVIWEPEHEQHPPADDEPVQITEDQIAISADAVHTTQIRDGTFRFAKTLTMPFMGSGIVDLPPGAEKRPKNSRKMHMVFFVHYGKVVVTVNEAQFRISAGGMWFVPRGEPYTLYP
jgi:centromere protein C